MPNMQTVGKKSRSTMYNITIISAIIEKQRQVDKNTDSLLADAEKWFDKL